MKTVKNLLLLTSLMIAGNVNATSSEVKTTKGFMPSRRTMLITAGACAAAAAAVAYFMQTGEEPASMNECQEYLNNGCSSYVSYSCPHTGVFESSGNRINQWKFYCEVECRGLYDKLAECVTQAQECISRICTKPKVSEATTEDDNTAPVKNTLAPATDADYDLLRVARDALCDTIKLAYRTLSLKAHPDKGGTEAEFIALTDAYNRVNGDKGC